MKAQKAAPKTKRDVKPVLTALQKRENNMAAASVMHKAGKSQRKIADTFGVHRTTVYQWLKVIDENDTYYQQLAENLPEQLNKQILDNLNLSTLLNNSLGEKLQTEITGMSASTIANLKRTVDTSAAIMADKAAQARGKNSSSITMSALLQIAEERESGAAKARLIAIQAKVTQE